MNRQKKRSISPLDTEHINEEINDIQEEIKNVRTRCLEKNTEYKKQIIDSIHTKFGSMQNNRNYTMLNKLVNKVIKMYPELKKDKSKIISKILKDTDDEKKKNIYQEYDNFDRISIDNKIYYRNNRKKIIVTSNLDLVGVFIQTNN